MSAKRGKTTELESDSAPKKKKKRKTEDGKKKTASTKKKKLKKTDKKSTKKSKKVEKIKVKKDSTKKERKEAAKKRKLEKNAKKAVKKAMRVAKQAPEPSISDLPPFEDPPEPAYSLDDPALPSSIFSKYMTRSRFEKPTEIQARCWPACLTGQDIIGVGATGSGKTLGYLLPAVARILGPDFASGPGKAVPIVGHTGPLVLVIAPTRELAGQVAMVGKRGLKPVFKIRSLAIYGGTPKEKQVSTLRACTDNIATTATSIKDAVQTAGGARGGGYHIIAATPGRLNDLVESNDLQLDRVHTVVLDEFDKLLSADLRPQIMAILDKCSPDCQKLMFSATFPTSLYKVVRDLVKEDAIKIEIKADDYETAIATLKSDADVPASGDSPCKEVQEGGQQLQDGSSEATEDVKAAPESKNAGPNVSKTIVQTVQVVAEHKKPRKLLKVLDTLLKKGNPAEFRVMVFVNKIKAVQFLLPFLKKSQPQRVCAFFGHMKQDEREQILKDFRSGLIPILVTTDVAGRGLDIRSLPFVINYDFPPTLEQYVHRVGRTGRQGKVGHAFTFFTRNRAPLASMLVKILRATHQELDQYLLQLAGETLVSKRKRRRDAQQANNPEATGNAATASSDISAVASTKDDPSYEGFDADLDVLLKSLLG